ncbi:MAG: hypothetical protein WCI54_13140 [Bacteroidia bacterium]|jgi:hypothetical protein
MKTNLHQLNRRNVHLFLAVAGTSGIAGLFLPFSWNTSPMKAVLDENVFQLAVPSFLSVFITAATIRWIISVSFSKAEKAIAYFVGLAAAGVTLSIYFKDGWWSYDFQGWLAFATPIVVMIAGSYLMLMNSKMQFSKKTNPLIAMQVPYLANCLMCLVMFLPNSADWLSGYWQIGAYFCLAASIVYMIQIALFLTQKDEISGKPITSVL